MASPRAANPGRTARFYRKNKASREKHNDDNNTGGKHAHTKSYKKAHSRARRRMDVMGKGGKDVVKNKSGQLRSRESMKINRGRGGSKRK
jgi:hypothetical protein